MGFEDWKHTVDVRMQSQYAIDTHDAGFDDEELQRHALSSISPDEFVNWIAKKYDLISIGSGHNV